MNMMSAVPVQMGGNTMSSFKHYLTRLKREVFHRRETFALEGGISFGPGRDPKGSFYGSPKLDIYWYQPNGIVLPEESSQEKGRLKGWLTKLGF